MKKINLLMFRSFIGPFLAIFFVANIIFVMQIFWLYLEDLIGKGLDIIVIGELFYYLFLSFTPQSLPIAVMMASIMCFGKLGETFELVAIKSAGVSFIRFMRPLLILSFIIGICSLIINSYIIPDSNLRRNVLLYSIVTSSPAFEIQEGVFFTKLKGSSIRIGKKHKDGVHLEDILIVNEKKNKEQEIIIAKKGKILVSNDKGFFKLFLEDGFNYQQSRDKNQNNTEFSRMKFKTYVKIFDISAFNPIELNEDNFKKNSSVMSTGQVMDESNNIYDRYVKQYNISINKIDGVLPLSRLDSMKDYVIPPNEKKIYESKLDDIIAHPNYANIEKAITSVNSLKNTLEFHKKHINLLRRSADLFKLEFNLRFTWPFLCVVFFLIGAPLGAITKKGGLGLPLLISIVAFATFFFLNSSLKKSVKQEAIPYFVGSWLQVLIFLVLGIIFCFKALNDSNLFTKEAYYRLYINTIGQFIKKRK